VADFFLFSKLFIRFLDSLVCSLLNGSDFKGKESLVLTQSHVAICLVPRGLWRIRSR
jgi:hypothetical protein